jgi:AcrR family transcriptional regulator
MKTTMDEIAYEAAISKPTIYKFFTTKEDLYFSLILPLIQECLNDMEEVNLQLQLNMFNSGEKLLRSVMNVFFKKYTDIPIYSE